MRFLGGGGQGCRGCVSIASRAAQTSAKSTSDRSRADSPVCHFPSMPHSDGRRGPGQDALHHLGLVGDQVRGGPSVKGGALIEDRSSAHAAAVMASQVTLAASTPRSASAGSSGVLVVPSTLALSSA